jgi:murein DD-endopeptidase MepM/ murein hydrolase activator NlpD
LKATDYVQAELTAGRLTATHIVELVEHFQDSYGLKVDGMPGPDTRKLIDRIQSANRGVTAQPLTLSSPMPVLSDGRKAVITSGFHTENPSRPNHNGVDFFYPWHVGDQPDFVGDKGCAGRTSAGFPKWGVPYGTSAVAACGGKVTVAGNSPTGFRCWVDHGNGWRTGYFHLLDLAVHIGDTVKTGDRLGLIGDSPRGSDGRHLHFEVSPSDRYAPVNPEPYLRPRQLELPL